MIKNILLDFVLNVFSLEIANHYTHTEHAVIIDFPDHTQAIIAAHPVAGYFPRRSVLPPLTKDHSYHYVHQHDYGYGREPEVVELNKLTLRSLEDCRVYLQDACENLLAAEFNDFEITFHSGPVYLLTITPLLKRRRQTKPHSAKRVAPTSGSKKPSSAHTKPHSANFARPDQRAGNATKVHTKPHSARRSKPPKART